MINPARSGPTRTLSFREPATEPDGVLVGLLVTELGTFDVCDTLGVTTGVSVTVTVSETKTDVVAGGAATPVLLQPVGST
jgi:hypothetical protein